MKSKFFLSAVFLLFSPIFLRAQCAMCKAVLTSSGNTGQAEAINQGIMYLMIWPYILIGGLGFLAWRALKKQTKKEEGNA